MKNSCIFLAVLALTSTGFAQGTTELKSENDKVSYSIGLDIGSTFKKQKMDINLEILTAGMKDGVSGKTPLLNEAQVKETMAAFSKSMVEKQAAEAKEASAKNAAAGEKFLAENKTKEGVKTTASGLQYKVMKEGTGASPKETDMVVVNYKGTLINGTEFDSSYKRNEPATFPVNRVIKGWTEALLLMKPGAKYQIFVPASLGYGERGAGQDIGPNETLIFDVELVSVKPPEAAPAPAAMKPAADGKPEAAGKPAAAPSPAAAASAKPTAPAKPSASPKPAAK